MSDHLGFPAESLDLASFNRMYGLLTALIERLA